MGQKVDLNIKNSINTNTIAEEVRAFQDAAAPALQNTGIERDGGVTNLYETAEAYPVAGDHFITEQGEYLESVISGDRRLISIGSKQIGQTSAYGVQSRTKIMGVDDAAITTAGTYITAAVKGAGIEVCEYTATGTLLHSRTTTFSNLAAVLQFFTSLSIIRYNGIDYADSLEFALRLGEQVIILKESTPGQSIAKSIQGVGVLGPGSVGNADVLAMIVWRGQLIMAGERGRVSSFDGEAWRYWDGTGPGTGIYNDGTAMGSRDIYAAIVYSPIRETEEYIVFGGGNAQICSYYGGLWNEYSKAGIGIWRNGGVVAGNILSLAVAYPPGGARYLVVGGMSGTVGSYSPGAWVVYTAGAGLRDNGTLVGAANIGTMAVIPSATNETIILFCGYGNGAVGSMRYTGGAWNKVVYTTPTTPNNPTNNGTVTGAGIFCSLQYGAHDVIFGGLGGVGMLKDWVWHPYTEAITPGVCVSSYHGSIYGLATFGSTVIASNGVTYDSWDQTAWKYYDGTGSGTGIWGTLWPAWGFIGRADLKIEYAGKLIAASAETSNYGAIGTITASNYVFPFYLVPVTLEGYAGNLLNGFGESSYLYVYKYENSRYLICLTGNSKNTSFILDAATMETWALYCQYAVPQISGGYSRHIIAGTPRAVGGAQVQALGLVGYTDFVSFNASVVYPDCPQTTPTIQKGVVGFDYADFTFKLAASATNIYNYLSQIGATPNGLFTTYQSQTVTNVDAYGKLTNGFGVAPSVPFEFRVNFINGIMSYLSAAVLDGISSGAMGTLLTNVGEFDPDYTPDFHDDRILYRYNGAFFLVVVGTTLTGNVFQKIAPDLYKVNTISPLNIVSMIDEALHVGSSDYNGRMIFEATALPSVAATNVAAVQAGSITVNPLSEGIFSNSVDVGDKLVYISSPTKANISIPGYRIPYGWQSIKEMISVYIADLYSYSVANDGSELTLVNPSNPVYVPDTRLPLAIGLEYEGGAVNTGQQTIFINPNYDGYVIGNEAKGVYDVFQLYGTTYLFDGVKIYQATLTGTVFSGLTEIAPATGLVFLSATPTQAYFLSAFDNSIFVFNGGRSLTKFQRLSQLPAVTGGIFSTRDNALLLETATSFIWVRDEIVTQNLKSAAQMALKLYDTQDGLYIGNDVSRWRYSYASLGGSSAVVPLVWQSSYLGQTSGQRSNVEQFFVTIYSPGKAAQIITARVDSFDEKAHYTQTVTFPIKPADYSSAGYYRFRVKPRTQKALGTSLTLTIPAKTVLSDLYVEYSDDAPAVVAGNATR